MLINGKERKMLLTVGATEKIAPLCPDGDFQKVFKISDDKPYNQVVDDELNIAVILINAYENSVAMENGTEPDLIAFEDFNKDAITPLWFRELEKEIVATMSRDMFGQVETEPVKKNEVNGAKKSH